VAKAILVPHDGHAMSDAALKYAIDIAKSMSMKVRLVRIIPEVLDISTMSHWTLPQRKRVRKDIKWQKERALEREYKRLQKQISMIQSRGVEASALVAEGVDVPEKIAEIIRKEKNRTWL
jgi:nucleotide-binding universal stress UspA family protein